MRSGMEINRVMVRQGLRGELFQELYHEIKEFGVPYQIVPEEWFSKFRGKNHQGVVTLISPVRYYPLEQVVPMIFESGKIPFILILDKVNDVRNFGAIARTAECAGVDAILVSSKGGALITADSVKTSAGGLYHIPVCRTADLKKAIRYLRESGIRILAASEKASISFFGTDLTGPVAIIMGSEEKGIAREYLELADETVSIPVVGQIESLNVSAATAVLCYETVRQRAIALQ
jgi:23S rRNA (guanosine2251-2'-O)-methyltransferase